MADVDAVKLAALDEAIKGIVSASSDLKFADANADTATAGREKAEVDLSEAKAVETVREADRTAAIAAVDEAVVILVKAAADLKSA